MDHAQILLLRLWEPFNTFMLFLYASAGTVIFTLIGLILAILLQRRGWLARRNRWHHGVLKLYFLLLPMAGGLLGFQAGSLYGTQQQIYRHMNSYAPLVQEMADSVRVSFDAYLAEQDQTALLDELQHKTVQQVLGQVALDYLREMRQDEAQQLEEASLFERVSLNLYDRLRASLIGQLVGERVVGEVAYYTSLDKQVLGQALDARVEQLFHADFLLDLLRKQVQWIFKPLYIALFVQVGLLLAFIAAEVLVSRRLRWTRPTAATLVSA
ncbi:hypothetical protein [Pseudomonas sp. GD03944]|uniref:hypothetical protein n=1 Tax=Pseudomonas sp. GD03944 TaxID=2975409 RepID=UPI00244B6FE7|nr:hypothetical protein [Pseudomonas sp. GD03944]MDH1262467.1 hypothetical protein [Pseudomonas sp. GD03944]